ncbi:ScyD/ScyE family protein [Calidifontibacter terrae]
MRLRSSTSTLAVACALSLAVAGAPAANAAGHAQAGHHWSTTIDDSVLAPFQLAVNHQNVYATDGLVGTVTKYDQQGHKTVLASTGGETDGIDVSPDGRTYAYTGIDSGGAYLQIVGPDKPLRVDLGTYEATRNPDAGVTYGIVAGGNPCAEAVLGQLTGGPATYTGVVDAHPYAVAWMGNGNWAVADAAGNDILEVTASGQISTLALLPTQPITITAEMVAAGGLPDCVAGVTYAFEPVPTDVEWMGGQLWVSTLPGGPEDASLGARGSVYRVSPTSGKSWLVAGGFLGATNLAVRPDGTVFVAELFGGKITGINGSKRWTAHSVASPLSVETQGSSLWFGTLADVDFETGTVNGPGSLQHLKQIRR